MNSTTVRSFVYDITMRRGTPPTLAETVSHFGAPADEVSAAFREMASARMLVLQRDSSEILMANPFSAVPTCFVVETSRYSCFGNCIWDALGIPAMLNEDARITASCGDCGTSMHVEVKAGALSGDAGLIHFAVPARQWWDDVVFN